MSELEVARRFMTQRLGADWEWQLLQADAYPAIGRSADVDAAEQRAIDLICETSNDWRPGLRDAAAYAWRVLSARN
jgi:hypothetical protein